MRFEEFPKIPRLKREIIITEKIDGTNGQIYICTKESLRADLALNSYGPWVDMDKLWEGEKDKEGAIVVGDCIIRAGSRSRWLTEKQDNFGFWRWVNEHREALSKLGPGRHYGEWWGQGIQRGYGLSEKRFSLFNTLRWNSGNPNRPDCCHVVPILMDNTEWESVARALDELRSQGSRAVPGYQRPEGIVIFHKASQTLFKVLLENDDKHKGELEAA